MNNIYNIRSNNVFKTWLLMSMFLVVFIVLGFLFSVYFNNPNILYVSLIFSLGMNFFSYYYSDSLALSLANAKEVKNRSDYTDLWNVVENLSITAGLPMPKLYIIDDPLPNAFATGRNEKNAAVAVTSGLLLIMNKSELEGVIAHELTHIKNKDILLQTIVVVMAGAIAMISDYALRFHFFAGKDNEKKSPIFLILIMVAAIMAPLAATIIRLSISRKREFLADAGGALLTRYPEGLASALTKISQYHQPLQNANNATAHLYISDPFGLSDDDSSKEKVSWFSKLFMTHPPTSERVAILTNMSKD